MEIRTHMRMVSSMAVFYIVENINYRQLMVISHLAMRKDNAYSCDSDA
jgi:hypothetical protein